MTVAAVSTLIVGLAFGYLGQRSRFCFVGGIRDYILIRDDRLLKGTVVFFVVAGLSFALLAQFEPGGRIGFSRPDGLSLWLTAVGGFGVGFLSVLANGCPFRQHVLAAQGNISSIGYLLGFFVGAVMFHTVTAPWLLRLLP
ncbi:MAG: YeeE/YedE thiosulfate transporter family protein [Halopseudomonas sp.]